MPSPFRKELPPSPKQNLYGDARNSYTPLYLSLIPFVVAEYLVERFTEVPPGIVFPLGYLMFWAFYFTYYRPQFFRDSLNPNGLKEIPAVILGVILWFIRVTIVSLVDFLFLRWFVQKVPAPKNNPKKIFVHKELPPQESSKPEGPPPLPQDAQEALKLLGIPHCRKWQDVHSRYRKLAKQYHPDLNPELTEVGRRFMKIDAAYKLLSQHKHLFIKSK